MVVVLGVQDDNSSYRRSIASLTGPRFLDLAAAGHREAAASVRALRLHVAVDLQGHTLGTRTEIAAQRVAPIQVGGSVTLPCGGTGPVHSPLPSLRGDTDYLAIWPPLSLS